MQSNAIPDPAARLLNACLVVLGGLGLFLGMPNPVFQISPLLLLCPACLYLLAARSQNPKAAFARGWVLGLIGQTLALYWLNVPMTEVGGLPLFASIPAEMLLTAYLSLYYGLAALVAHCAHAWFVSPAPQSPRALLAPLTAGLAFAGAEIVCGRLFTGFPWLNLASGFATFPVWIQAAALVGSYGLSAVFATAAAFAAQAALSRGVKNVLVPQFLCIILLAAVWAYGQQRLNEAAAPGPEATKIRFVLVQGNIDQNQKWTLKYQQSTVDHYIRLTKKGLAQARSMPDAPAMTVALWPETAMPFSFENEPHFADQVRAFILKEDVGLGLGTLYMKRTPGELTLANRFLMLNSSGGMAGHYDKEHLVPFGEYIPGPLDFEFLRNIMQGMAFTPGESAGPIHYAVRDPLADAPRPPLINGEPQVITGESGVVTQKLAAGVLICYEAIFPELAQARVEQGADILINVSNDGWFGKTSAPVQHLGLAAMRAVEQNRYLVRCTNTGYTALVNPYGIVEQRGGLYTDEVFVFDAFALTEQTVFHHLFPFQELFLTLCPLVLLLLGRLTRNRTQKPD